MAVNFRRQFLPYVLKRLESGEYLVLNRDYKPLGIPNGSWVVYETHPSLVKLKITPEMAKRLAWDQDENTAEIHLYNDASVPTDSDEKMAAYLRRLELLMRLTDS